MTTKKAKSNQTLRQRAEEKLRAGGAAVQTMRSLDEANLLCHELQVRQIELEMQKEELRQAQTELEFAKARYFDLYDLAPVGYLTINEKGLILTANLTAATLLGIAQNSLVMQPFSRFILPEDTAIYSLQQQAMLTTGVQQRWDMRMRRADGSSFWAYLQTTLAPDGECRITLNDVSERKCIEEVQAFLARTSSGTQAEPFFEALARYLARSLGMDFVCIDRLEGDGLTARTLAVWSDGHFEDNLTYALKDTPCGEVVGKTVCCFPASVRQFFPRDQVLKNLRAESYAGVTLWSHSGQPIGLIAVVGHQPLVNQPMAESLLKLVAIRAAAELERLEAEGALRERIKELDCLYAIADLIEKEDTLEKILQGTVELMPCSWLFNEIACARIMLGEQEFKTANFHETAWRQASDIFLLGKPVGRVELYYLEERPIRDEGPFLREERNLIDAIAERLGRVVEHKRAEEELRASEELHRAILRTAMDGFWVVDMQGRLLEVNETYCRMSGYSEQELLAMRIADLEVVEDVGAVASHIQKIMAKGEDRFVSQHRRKDGSIFDVEVSVQYRLNEGRLFGFMQDISERRQAESTKAWLSSIVESSHDAIISREFDGTIRSWNKGAEQMFGYGAGEMLGNTIDVLFVAEQADGFDDFDFLCRSAGAGHAEPCCQDKDGQRFTVLLTQSPILGQDGEAVAVSVIMSDISNHREMERQLLEANKDLEKKVAERTDSLQQRMAQLRRLALELTQTEQRERQRLATVLHNDLQQLLVAAGLRLERLSNTESNADKRQAIQQVETFITQAVATTRSLATDLRPPVLTSGNLVKSLQWLADWLWKRFDFTLKFSMSGDLQMEAIPDQDTVFIFDATRELCFNIVKHAHVKEGRLELQRTANNRLRLSVVDDGIGMDVKRQDLPVSADGGLGLNAIRARLGLIGGDLHISSAVGQGFRADIVLPYALAAIPVPQAVGGKVSKAGPGAAGRQSADVSAGRKIRVMLVDDHAMVRDGLKMILQDEVDIEVVGEAGDGEKALKMVGQLLPDVVMMDVNMPKMDGIAATKLIKQNYPGICVIALSINDDPGTSNAMLEAGASMYLNKSGSADDVCRAIKACLRGQ